MIESIIMLVFIVAMMVLMMTNKVPTVVALFAMTLGISFIGGIPLTGDNSIFKTVITDGSIGMASSYIVAIIAAWLGCALIKTGVTENIIRKAAEFGGDKVLIVTIVIFVATIFLQANITGLGAVIMVGSIVIPILISAGVDKLTAGCVMLLAVGAGNQLGVGRPTYIANVVGADFDTLYAYSRICALVTAVAGLAFIIYRYLRCGKKFAFSAEAEPVRRDNQLKGIRGALAMVTPVLPIVLVAFFKWSVLPALFFAILWLFVWTARSWKKACNLLMDTCYEGFKMAAPSVILMVFIGMLLKAVGHTNVASILGPLTEYITPTTMIGCILFFSILAPLALYRGPLTVYGLGAGIATLMVASGLLPVMVIAAGFMSNGCLLTTSCPTNSHNIWVSGYVEEDVTNILKRQGIFMWIASAIAMVIGAVMYW